MFLQVIFETRVDITSAVCALWLGKNFVIFYILKSAVMLCDAVWQVAASNAGDDGRT